MRKKGSISSSFNTVHLMGEFSVQKQVINNNKQKIDLDFISQSTIDQTKVETAMKELGFERREKYYYCSQTPHFFEFISGPPFVGQDPIEEIQEIKLPTSVIRTISPTDSAKDRLAAFYHWGDRLMRCTAIMWT
jgi:hypothetical protein